MIVFEKLLGLAGVCRISGHTFLPGLVSESPSLLDCGTHKAAFTTGILKKFPKLERAVCVEANPFLANLLQEHPPRNSSIKNAAIVGDESLETISLNISSNPEASSVFGEVSESYGTDSVVSVPCVTLGKLIELFDDQYIDILKMDVEGAENEVLLRADPTELQKFTQLLVEFHDNFSPEMRPDVLKVRKRLRSIGFIEINANWPYTDDILFVNRKAVGRLNVGLKMRISILKAAYMFRGLCFSVLRRLRLKA